MKKKTLIINFILDRSGSMESCKNSIISGFNEYINGLKKDNKVKVKFSLTTFDSLGIDRPYINTSIKQVEPLSDKTFVPRGGTPLYDAAVDTIEAISEVIKKEDSSLVVIMTDGEENSSTKHDEKCLKDLIKKLTKRGNWTFTFMGANQDAWANAQKYGISTGNTLSWESNEKGTRVAYANLAFASSSMMASVAKGHTTTDSFFGGGEDK